MYSLESIHETCRQPEPPATLTHRSTNACNATQWLDKVHSFDPPAPRHRQKAQDTSRGHLYYT